MLVSCTYLNNKFIHTYIHILDKKTVIYMYTCKSRMLYLPKYLKKKKKKKKKYQLTPFHIYRARAHARVLYTPRPLSKCHRHAFIYTLNIEIRLRNQQPTNLQKYK